MFWRKPGFVPQSNAIRGQTDGSCRHYWQRRAGVTVVCGILAVKTGISGDAAGLRTDLFHGAGKHDFDGHILFRINVDLGGLYWHQCLFWWRTGTNRWLGLLLVFFRPFDNLG